METATLEILKIKPRKPHYDTVSRRPHRVIVFSSVTVTVVWAKQFETARSLACSFACSLNILLLLRINIDLIYTLGGELSRSQEAEYLRFEFRARFSVANHLCWHPECSQTTQLRRVRNKKFQTVWNLPSRGESFESNLESTSLKKGVHLGQEITFARKTWIYGAD